MTARIDRLTHSYKTPSDSYREKPSRSQDRRIEKTRDEKLNPYKRKPHDPSVKDPTLLYGALLTQKILGKDAETIFGMWNKYQINFNERHFAAAFNSLSK